MAYSQFWRSVTISESGAGMRLDVFLSRRFSRYSRSEIVRHIKEGRVVSTQRKLKSSSVLKQGEVLRLFVPGLAPTTPPPPLPPILYEDEHIIAVNKPSGMLVHPSGDTFVWALISLFRRQRPAEKIDLIHRLDKETSGVLLLSKSADANRFVKAQLAARKIKKVYHAIVRGVPSWDSLEVQKPIGNAMESEIGLRRGVNPEGVDAHTTFRVLQKMHHHAKVECRLHTGKTHQIRVHLESVGFPIVGDKIYGQPDWVFLEFLKKGYTPAVQQATKVSRQLLHAHWVSFPHLNGEQLRIVAPLPAEFNLPS